MRRLKAAVVIIAVVTAIVVIYVAYGPLTNPVVICMRGGAGIGSGVLVTAEMNVNPSGDSGNLTLTLKDQTCGYISGAEVTSMRPSALVNGIPHQENLSNPSLITNASFVTYDGALVSPTNRIPLRGSAMGSLSVSGVEVGTSYTMDIIITFSGNPGLSNAHVTAEVTAT